MHLGGSPPTPVSLRAKILAVLAAVALLSGVTMWAVQELVILPGFGDVEAQQARDDLDRCSEAIRRDAEHVSFDAHDYGSWDDTWAYMADGNTAYEEANLVPDIFTNTDLNLIAFLHEDGRVQWSRMWDLQAGKPIDAPEVFAAVASSPLVHAPKDGMAGVFVSTLGPMIVAARQVLTTANTGPSRGVVIMGRLLDANAVSELAGRTRVALHLWALGDPQLPLTGRALLDRLAREPEVLDVDDPDTLLAYTVLPDVTGAPALLVRADVPRTVAQRGATAVTLAGALSLASELAILGATWFALRALVVHPLARLTAHAVRIGNDPDLRGRLNLPQRDEIGALAGELDRMVEQLDASRRAMLDVAHRAGQAEVAVEVLHNVGNVLTGVTVSAGLLAERARAGGRAELADVVALLEKHEEDLAGFVRTDGPHLLGYLRALRDAEREDRAGLERDIERLETAVAHIRAVLQSQDERKGARLLEVVTPATLVDEALRLHAAALEGYRVSMIRRIEADGVWRVDRHRVLQILSNLLRNALDAVAQVGDRAEICLTVAPLPDGPGLRFVVDDNGVGVRAEDLTRIFSSGYTTRAGSLGLGLHSAANMARELGGSLHAASAGPGRGATFTLDLPGPPA